MKKLIFMKSFYDLILGNSYSAPLFDIFTVLSQFKINILFFSLIKISYITQSFLFFFPIQVFCLFFLVRCLLCLKYFVIYFWTSFSYILNNRHWKYSIPLHSYFSFMCPYFFIIFLSSIFQLFLFSVFLLTVTLYLNHIRFLSFLPCFSHKQKFHIHQRNVVFCWVSSNYRPVLNFFHSY